MALDPAKTREMFLQAADKAAAAHQNIEPSVFRDVAGYYGTAYQKYNEAVQKLTSDAEKKGVRYKPDWYREKIAGLKEQHFGEAQRVVLEKFPDGIGKTAWEGITKELTPPSMAERLIKPFYDEEKGGLRPGGMVGAALGAAAALFMTGGGGGGLFGLLVVALGTALGAYGGNLAADTLMQPNAGQSQNQPYTPRQQQQLRGVGQNTPNPHHVSHGQLSHLSPSSLPKQPPVGNRGRPGGGYTH